MGWDGIQWPEVQLSSRLSLCGLAPPLHALASTCHTHTHTHLTARIPSHQTCPYPPAPATSAPSRDCPADVQLSSRLHPFHPHPATQALYTICQTTYITSLVYSVCLFFFLEQKNQSLFHQSRRVTALQAIRLDQLQVDCTLPPQCAPRLLICAAATQLCNRSSVTTAL
mgnify:CR=1 FL=1